MGTRCDAYCKCTGTAAPSRYEIVNTGQYYDHHNDYSYLPGKWGKDGGNGAYGTTGGIPVHKNGMDQMTIKRTRTTVARNSTSVIKVEPVNSLTVPREPCTTAKFATG